jgi:hypothetical protein
MAAKAKFKKEAEFKTLSTGPVFKKTNSTGIRISELSIDGEVVIDIRQVYRKGEDGEWLPTGKGYTLPVEKAEKVLRRFADFAKTVASNAK